jgi:hypothetical protein
MCYDWTKSAKKVTQGTITLNPLHEQQQGSIGSVWTVMVQQQGPMVVVHSLPGKGSRAAHQA